MAIILYWSVMADMNFQCPIARRIMEKKLDLGVNIYVFRVREAK